MVRTFPAGAELLDPYPFFAEMRASHPVVFDERADRWAVYRYADVSAVLTDHERFPNSMTEPGTVPDAGARRFAGLLAFDPPRHTRMRNLVMRAFTASAVARLEGRTRSSVASGCRPASGSCCGSARPTAIPTHSRIRTGWT
ncbi:MAG TPA: hypothetical protein VF469_11365 [Kofleriaceae bacterium]